MRATFAYTFARILLFAVALGLLSLVGARGLLRVGFALVISGIVSFVVLSRYRDAMSGAITSRISRFRERLDEGSRAEDDDPASAGARDPAPAGGRDPASAADPASAGGRDPASSARRDPAARRSGAPPPPSAAPPPRPTPHPSPPFT